MINILIRKFALKQTVADQNALEQFQKQWSTYQKLVDADALSHRAAGKLLHDALFAIPRPFAFVDIACGDASQMREVLSGKCEPGDASREKETVITTKKPLMLGYILERGVRLDRRCFCPFGD